MTTTTDFFENLAHSPDSGLGRGGAGEGDNRRRLLRAIDGLAAEGPVPADVNAVAIRLSTKFPQSGLTIDEICRRIDLALRERPGR